MNKFNLPNYNFAQNGTLFMLSFTGNLALNTTSSQSDYALQLSSSGYNFAKLSSSANWRFSFKVIIVRNYYSNVFTISEKFGNAQVPQGVYWFSFGLNRSDDWSSFGLNISNTNSHQNFFESSFRFIGNFLICLEHFV